MIALVRVSRALARACVALAAAGCAAPDSGDLREGTEKVIAPFESHEECVWLDAGDRLDWSFSADMPVAFEIRYEESNATLIPIAREGVASDAAIFRAVLPRRYCAAWESGPMGAFLTYRLRRLPPPP
jgi:hypothetical protein